jgi:hypothetical protein
MSIALMVFSPTANISSHQITNFSALQLVRRVGKKNLPKAKNVSH